MSLEQCPLLSNLLRYWIIKQTPKRREEKNKCDHYSTTCVIQPGLKSQSKSALNSAVSEILKISALISAVSELFSAGTKRIEKPTKMLRVSSKRYWDHEKHVLLECTSYEKSHSGENSVKNSNWRTRLFLMLLGRT